MSMNVDDANATTVVNSKDDTNLSIALIQTNKAIATVERTPKILLHRLAEAINIGDYDTQNAKITYQLKIAEPLTNIRTSIENLQSLSNVDGLSAPNAVNSHPDTLQRESLDNIRTACKYTHSIKSGKADLEKLRENCARMKKLINLPKKIKQKAGHLIAKLTYIIPMADEINNILDDPASYEHNSGDWEEIAKELKKAEKDTKVRKYTKEFEDHLESNIRDHFYNSTESVIKSLFKGGEIESENLLDEEDVKRIITDNTFFDRDDLAASFQIIMIAFVANKYPHIREHSVKEQNKYCGDLLREIYEYLMVYMMRCSSERISNATRDALTLIQNHITVKSDEENVKFMATKLKDMTLVSRAKFLKVGSLTNGEDIKKFRDQLKKMLPVLDQDTKDSTSTGTHALIQLLEINLAVQCFRNGPTDISEDNVNQIKKYAKSSTPVYGSIDVVPLSKLFKDFLKMEDDEQVLVDTAERDKILKKYPQFHIETTVQSYSKAVVLDINQHFTDVREKSIDLPPTNMEGVESTPINSISPSFSSAATNIDSPESWNSMRMRMESPVKSRSSFSSRSNYQNERPWSIDPNEKRIQIQLKNHFNRSESRCGKRRNGGPFSPRDDFFIIEFGVKKHMSQPWEDFRNRHIDRCNQLNWYTVFHKKDAAALSERFKSLVKRSKEYNLPITKQRFKTFQDINLALFQG